MNRPGGNITGLSLMAAEMHGKCVELFRDMLPFVRRVAVLLNAEDPFWKQVQEQVQLAGQGAGIEIAPSTDCGLRSPASAGRGEGAWFAWGQRFEVLGSERAPLGHGR
jgi:hypothetical protein